MNPKELTEKELLAALKNGGHWQNQAVKQLYYTPVIVGAANNYKKQFSLQQADLEDIMQDAFIVFVNKIRKGEFKEEGKLTSFLISIIKFKCLERVRKNQKLDYQAPENLLFKEFGLSQEAIIIELENQKEDKLLKRHLFSQLGDKCKKLLKMDKAYTMKEIALEMDWTSVQTAKNNVANCKKEFRKITLADAEAMQLIKTKGWKITKK